MSDAAITVVVPTRDRPGPLAACLAALAELTPPPGGFEVVVVDDGGARPAEAPAPRTAPAWSELRILRAPHAGPAAARNAGAAAARGVLLVFTDDDCRPEPGWLVALDEALRSGHDVAGGRIVNELHGDPWASASQALLERIYDWYNADPHDARFLASSNLAVRAEVFARIGGFDEAYPTAAGEDRDLCQRFHEAGVRMAYESAAVVRHAHPLSFRRFWRQHLSYGRGAARFHRSRARRTGQRVRVEPASFYRLLLRGDPRMSGRIAIAQVANALGAALQWRRRTR